MKLKIKAGTSSQILRVFIQDTASTVGAGLTGLTHSTSGLKCYYARLGASTSTAVTLVTATAGTYTSGGFIALDGTNMPGVYELHVPNAVFATGATAAHLMLYGAANMAPVLIEVELDSVDYRDSTRFGLTALPNAAAEANGGLITRGTGTGQMSVLSGSVSAAIATDGIGPGSLSTATYAAIAAAMLDVVRTGTAQAGGSTSITLDAGASSTNDTYTGQIVRTTGGTGPEQSRIITAYNGSTKVATVDRAWATNPTSSTTFAILAQGPAHLMETINARLTATRANNLDNLNVSLSTINTNLSAVQTIVTTSGVAIADGYITAAKIGTGAITAAKFAADAITSTVFANDAITAAKVASDVGTEIATAVWSTAVPGSFTSGQAGNVLGNVATGTPPTAAAIASQVWSTAVPGSFTSGQAGNVLGNVATGTPPTAAAIATQVWSTALPGSFTSGQAGNIVAAIPTTAAPTAAVVADAVWDELISGHSVSGSFAAAVTTDQASLTSLLSGQSTAAATLSAISSNVSAILDDTGTSGVVVAAGSKGGYSLAAAGLDSIPVETGVNARQALSPILAAAAGVLSGAGTGTIVIKGGNVATTRITATTDASGNRSAITLALPS